MIAQIQMRRGTSAEWAEASPIILADGEPGWDSTLKGMKIGDGVTEWGSLPWIDVKNNHDIRLGQNILHNADFRNPVNQRGVSGEISTGTYFFDRWIRNSGTVTVNAGYLTLASGAVIEQRIEGNLLAGETVTVSVMVGGTVFSGTGTMPTSGTASVTLPGWGTATLGYATGYMYLRLSPSAASNVERVKLELGPVSTLHLDPPMDHAVELAKCQRLYRPLPNGSGRLFNATNSQIEFAYELSPPMRIKPTVSIPSLTNAVLVQNVSYYIPTSYDIWSSSTKDLVVVKMFGSFPTINNLISMTASGAALSAEL